MVSNYFICMKTIHLFLEDREYDALVKIKGELSWKELLMTTIKER